MTKRDMLKLTSTLGYGPATLLARKQATKRKCISTKVSITLQYFNDVNIHQRTIEFNYTLKDKSQLFPQAFDNIRKHYILNRDNLGWLDKVKISWEDHRVSFYSDRLQSKIFFKYLPLDETSRYFIIENLEARSVAKSIYDQELRDFTKQNFEEFERWQEDAEFEAKVPIIFSYGGSFGYVAPKEGNSQGTTKEDPSGN